MTNMDNTINFTNTQHTRFDMVSPVARETGATDDLSTTRGSVPGNTCLGNSELGGCSVDGGKGINLLHTTAPVREPTAAYKGEGTGLASVQKRPAA